MERSFILFDNQIISKVTSNEIRILCLGIFVKKKGMPQLPSGKSDVFRKSHEVYHSLLTFAKEVPESSSLRLLGQPKLSAGCLVVEGQPGERAFDVQTLTCLASREVVGIIVDIFGSIDSPWYVIMPRDDLAWCSGLEVHAVMTGANFVNPDDLLSDSDSDASEAEEIAAVSDTPG